MVSAAISRLDYTILSLMVGISAIFGAVYIALRSQLNLLNIKSLLIFIGLVFLYFILLSLTSLWHIKDVRLNYWLVQLFSLSAGVLYARYMFILREKDSHNLRTDLVLTFFLCFFAMLSYYLGYSLWSSYIIEEVLEEGQDPEKTQLGLFASLACLPFIVPFFVRLSYNFLNIIPAPIYPKWYFPIKKEAPPFVEVDGALQTKINLQFTTKELGGEEFTRLTLIPKEMILGDFFHIYFDAWNEQQETSRKVELADKFDRPFAFIFHAIKKNEPSSKRRLDPTKTTLYNKLTNEDLILIERESRY
jgi:hypothetical protein